MKKVKTSALPEVVKALRKRIEAWRRTRKKISPMPEQLWSTATALATKHGVCRIARAIQIDYAALKRRLIYEEERPFKPGFIELPASAFGSDRGEAVVELSDDTGAKMTCRINGRAELNVIALADAFWKRHE